MAIVQPRKGFMIGGAGMERGHGRVSLSRYLMLSQNAARDCPLPAAGREKESKVNGLARETLYPPPGRSGESKSVTGSTVSSFTVLVTIYVK